MSPELLYEVRRQGRRRSGSMLNADEVVALMGLVAGDAKFGLNISNKVASEILARLCGGSAETFENALTEKWREYGNGRREKMEKFLASEEEWLKSIGFVR